MLLLYVSALSWCPTSYGLKESQKLPLKSQSGMLQGTGRPGKPMYRSARSFMRDARLNRKLALPAVLYAVNNYLKFVMQLYFKPTTAKMLSNLKVRSQQSIHRPCEESRT